MNGPMADGAELSVEALERSGLQPVTDLQVEAGETLCLHGPSGSGKTLLLRAIADLDPNQGRVRLGRQYREQLPAPLWRRQVIYVPPESHWWAERVRPHAEAWSPPWLARLGFEPDVLDREVRRLSTGERQRLAILRALARRPRALLLDEPTANLDDENTRHVESLLRDYQQAGRVPMLWVSHDPRQRERVANRTRAMRRGVLQ